MTPEFCCGFECGVSGSHWTATGAIFTTTSPIAGTRSLRCNPSASIHSAKTADLFSGGLIVWRQRINFTTLLNATVSLGYLTSGGAAISGALPGVYFNSTDNKIYAGTNRTALGATGVSVTTGTTYYIDVKVNVNATTYTVDVQVNGTACGQATVAGTATTAAVAITVGTATVNSTGDFLVDDVLVSTTSTDYPLGDGYVNHFVPTADGTHNVAGANDFERTATGTDITNATTDAYLLVDDVPLESGTPTDYINLIAPPNATDYVEVVFGPAPGISTPTVAPRAVEVITCAGKGTGTGANNLRLAVNDNGTLDDIFNADCSGTSPALRYPRKHYATGPAGAWTIGGGGAGDFTDLRMRCFSSDAAPDPWFISAMVEAEFGVSGALTLAVTDDLNAAF